MIRVLHIGLSHQFGGIESFLLNLSKAVDHSEFSFDYVAYGPVAPREDEFAALGTVHHLTNRRNLLAYAHELLALMDGGYDVVHIHKNSAADIVPFLCSRRVPGLKVVAHAHNTSSDAVGVTAALNPIGRGVIVRTSDALLACSAVAARWLYSAAADRAILVPNGIDVSSHAFDPVVRERVRAELNVGADIVVGCVGRFSKQKNQAFLVEVLRELLAGDISARVLFLGDGTELEATRRAFKAAGLGDRVLFLGSVRNVVDYMQAMDVLAMPSLFEGLPLTAVEGQAAGLPVLMSDRITDEVCLTDLAIRLPISDSAPVTWAERIASITRKDTRGMTNLGAVGPFDVRNTAMKMQVIYTDLVGKRQ